MKEFTFKIGNKIVGIFWNLHFLNSSSCGYSFGRHTHYATSSHICHLQSYISSCAIMYDVTVQNILLCFKIVYNFKENSIFWSEYDIYFENVYFMVNIFYIFVSWHRPSAQKFETKEVKWLSVFRSSMYYLGMYSLVSRLIGIDRVPTSSGNHGKPGKSLKKVPCIEKSWILKKTE